jgi:hypothetical protein
MRTNERGPSLVDSSCRYNRFLSCLGCCSQHSTKYYFPHRTLFHLISPHRPAGQAGVLDRLSLCLRVYIYRLQLLCLTVCKFYILTFLSLSSSSRFCLPQFCLFLLFLFFSRILSPCPAEPYGICLAVMLSSNPSRCLYTMARASYLTFSLINQGDVFANP